MGLEPTASGVTVQRSNQLSYTHRSAGPHVTRSRTLARVIDRATRPLVWISAFVLCSCAPRTHADRLRGATPPPPAALDQFATTWLAPARIAPPTIDFEPMVATSGQWTATATPFLVEDAAWNRWPEENRLFNNRVAYWFDVEVHGSGELRWLPEETWVDLNGRQRLRSAPTPEELLEPLFAAAVAETRAGGGRRFADRTRAAGPYRDGYLPIGTAVDAAHGWVAFPTGGIERHVTRIELEVTIATHEGTRRFTWLFD